MSVSKRSTGSGFQISLKFDRALIVVKTDRRHNLPWHVFGSVGGAALIVYGYSLLEIICKSDVALLGLRNAL